MHQCACFSCVLFLLISLINGQKLCSECEFPPGTGDDFINENLNIFLHTHCFQCGICKGMFGDTMPKTDASIQNGILHCSECYEKSKTVSSQASNRESKTQNIMSNPLNKETQQLNEASNSLSKESELVNEDSELLNEASNPLNEESELVNEDSELLNEASNPLNKDSELLNEASNPLNNESEPLNEESKPLNGDSKPLTKDLIEQVLVRNHSTAWYNRGRLIHDYSNDSFLVQTEDKQVKTLYPQDVIRDNKDKSTVVKVGDAVMCPYPTIDVQYCPAEVLQELPMMWLQVRYYDGTEGYVAREEAYLINDAHKHETITDIIRKEEAVIGRTVVARNDKDGIYYIGTVAHRDWTGPRFLIEWTDGSQSVQEAMHMSAVLPELRNLGIGSHVLALANSHPESFAYMPGIVMKTDNKQWDVHFINGKRALLFHRNQMYWLSEKYYKLSEMYFEKKQRKT